MSINRRSFLRLLSAGAVSTRFAETIAKALAIPAATRTGTIADVEHIVFLMQENRSFDHYLGTLNGVRGFSDPRAVQLNNGRSVFHQPSGIDGADSYVLPFRPTAKELGLAWFRDLKHDWDSTHVMWNEGRWDKWVPAKTPQTMAYLTRADIPYHYALADAFTVCDAYYTSLLGPTDPNRYHMFTGWTGNDGKAGGPDLSNDESGYFNWLTFPEVLEDAGITWRVYQDIGTGLNEEGKWGDCPTNQFIGNYGDNSLLYFKQYREAPESSPLYQRARTGTDVAKNGGTLFDHLRRDCMAGTLPQVSWICAPHAYTEHPAFPANYGAYYISQVLDSLTANPEVWSKTAFFVMYDENDGYFDHSVPPTPPQTAAHGQSMVATTNEIYPAAVNTKPHRFEPGPFGLGPRVPMFVISPWSKGGWVSSEVFDHTSMIRFVQARFGTKDKPLAISNITPWRKAVCGDLTSAFNFATPNEAPVKLPSTITYIPPDQKDRPSYAPDPPTDQHMPVQEKGARPARPVPYRPNVMTVVDQNAGKITFTLENTGSQATFFHVRPAGAGESPRGHTVTPGGQITDEWNLLEAYDLSIYGPNGFFRRYCGGAAGASAANIETECSYDDAANGVNLKIRNAGPSPISLQISNGYTEHVQKHRTGKGDYTKIFVPLTQHAGWYDLILTVESDPHFRQQLAGHVESGKGSTTDPAIG